MSKVKDIKSASTALKCSMYVCVDGTMYVFAWSSLIYDLLVVPPLLTARGRPTSQGSTLSDFVCRTEIW